MGDNVFNKLKVMHYVAGVRVLGDGIGSEERVGGIGHVGRRDEMAAVESGVGEGLCWKGVEFVVFAPMLSGCWRGGGFGLMSGPERALVLGVVANGEGVALGEGGGAVGEDEEEKW